MQASFKKPRLDVDASSSTHAFNSTPATGGGMPRTGLAGAAFALPRANAPAASTGASGAGAAAAGSSTAQGGSSGAAAESSSGGGGGGRTDVMSLIDAVGSAGVDIEAEQEAILRGNEMLQPRYGAPSRPSRTRVQEFLNPVVLRERIRAAAAPHLLQRVDEDCLAYLALAAQARLRSLVESMISASQHRQSSSHAAPPPLHPDLPTPTPMYTQVISSDVDKQLAALERIEREEETRRRRERVEREALERQMREEGEALGGGGMGDGADAGAEDESGKKKGKKRKDGPTSARNMSEDVQKRLSDQTALRSAGGLSAKYSWMTGGGSAAAALGAGKPKGGSTPSSPRTTNGLPKPKFTPQPPGTLNSPVLTPSTSGSGAAAGAAGGGWVRGAPALGPAAHAAQVRDGGEEKRMVNMRDALFALERERGMGAGRGSGQRAAWRRYARLGE